MVVNEVELETAYGFLSKYTEQVNEALDSYRQNRNLSRIEKARFENILNEARFGLGYCRDILSQKEKSNLLSTLEKKVNELAEFVHPLKE